jgi:hypothetical protein
MGKKDTFEVRYCRLKGKEIFLLHNAEPFIIFLITLDEGPCI